MTFNLPKKEKTGNSGAGIANIIDRKYVAFFEKRGMNPPVVPSGKIDSAVYPYLAKLFNFSSKPSPKSHHYDPLGMKSLVAAMIGEACEDLIFFISEDVVDPSGKVDAKKFSKMGFLGGGGCNPIKFYKSPGHVNSLVKFFGDELDYWIDLSGINIEASLVRKCVGLAVNEDEDETMQKA